MSVSQENFCREYEKEPALQARLIERAWKSNDFRQSLIKNPKHTIEREFNIRLPDNIILEVLEETSDKLYIVLPNNDSADSSENLLTEEELTAVTGIQACVYCGGSKVTNCGTNTNKETK